VGGLCARAIEADGCGFSAAVARTCFAFAIDPLSRLLACRRREAYRFRMLERNE
jgi:hypothetical protein